MELSFSFQDRHVHCMSYSFESGEFQTHVRRSARAGDNRKQSNQPGESFIENSADLFVPHRSVPTAPARLCYWLQNIQNHQLFSENRTDPKSLCSHRSNSPFIPVVSFSPWLAFEKTGPMEWLVTQLIPCLKIKQLSHPTPRRCLGILAWVLLSKSLFCSLLRYFCPFPFLSFIWKPIPP